MKTTPIKLEDIKEGDVLLITCWEYSSDRQAGDPPMINGTVTVIEVSGDCFVLESRGGACYSWCGDVDKYSRLEKVNL